MGAETVPRAIILAAGKSSKFFPPLYDRPKGLFTFRGEVLIERQIRQLRQVGIDCITVVIGYEKERFFYLAERFGVDLVVSMRYNDGGSLSSLEHVRDRLGGSYLCAADHWYDKNPFRSTAPGRSVRLVQRSDSAMGEFVATTDSDGRIVRLDKGAPSGDCLVGYAYVTEADADRLFELYDGERDRFGVTSMHWEEFWGMHLDEVPLFAMTAPRGTREFDNLGELRALDPNVLENVSQEAVGNISRLLSCVSTDILDVEPLNRGLTNVSFSFRVRGERYVYRQPGYSSSNMVDRAAEVVAQRAAMRLGIDPSVIDIGESGWKLSRYVEASRPFSYDRCEDLEAGIAQIRAFHSAGVTCSHAVDLLSEGDRLQGLASSRKGDLAEKHAPLHTDLVRLWHHVELDAVPKVLCHNDTYAVNWIVSANGYCLIDWEYAGMNDPYNDIATLTVRDGLTQDKNDELLRLFLGHEPSFRERRHDYAINALCGWYWYNWALFKGTLEEDGFFMPPSWRALNYYLPLALDMYDCPERYGESR